MAGECPHSTFLDTTLQQCHNGSALVASNHESYLKIIGDLKNDLEQISCEVIMVQKECSEQHEDNDSEDVGFASSLQELEAQNDRLEQALKQQTQAKDAALIQLQTNNETLQYQLPRLHRIISEKDQKIQLLSGLLKNNSQIQRTESKQAACEYDNSRNNPTAEHVKKMENLAEKLDRSSRKEQFLHRELGKLTEELNESRRKNRDLVSQTHRLAGLLKCQESHRMELAAKYEALEQNYEDQSKKLSTANNQLCMLDGKFQTLEHRQSERNMECNLLREEVLSLKEKHACAMGCLKSIQDQVLTTEKELYNAHEVIKEQKNIMQRNERIHSEEICKLQETNSQLKGKFADLVRDHKKLQEEHEKQEEINTQQAKLIENFRKWKDQQRKADQSTNDDLQIYQNMIKTILQEKDIYIAKYHDVSKEYSLLKNELDRLKLCPLSSPHSKSLLHASERSIPHLFERVRHTTHRVSEQNSFFKEEAPPALRDDSNSTLRPTEETL